MCGIAICKYSEARNAFNRQIDRGTDSLWIVTNERIKRVTGDLKTYNEWFDECDAEIDSNELVLFHHRAASVGKVNIDNAHPFMGKKFILFQNWTSRKVFSQFKTDYNEEVDSKVILWIIEDFADTIEEVPNVIDLLKEETNDTVGILIIQDFSGKTLLYTDWARESDIKIKDWKLKSVYNYAPWKKSWYRNNWWLLFNQNNWKIIEKHFEKMNTIPFAKPKVVNPYEYSNYYYDYLDRVNKREKYSPIGYNDNVTYTDLTENDKYELPLIRDFIREQGITYASFTYLELGDEYCYYSYWVDKDTFEDVFEVNLDNVLSYCYKYIIV